MKILDNNNYIEVTCTHCNSKLGVHKEDIRYNEIPHNCSEFEAICGACGGTVGIETGEIPPSWIDDIVPNDTGH
jgi:sialic acid synthase SpsE